MRYLGGTVEDLKRDMASIAEDPETQRWWKVSRSHADELFANVAKSDDTVGCVLGFCFVSLAWSTDRQVTDPMQSSFIPGAVGSASGPGWWTTGEEVFRMEG
jgi:hypothetical protein